MVDYSGFAVKVDDRELRRAFKDLREKSIPYAIANALNAVAAGARSDLQDDMKKVFDRPTPFTLNAFYVVKAGPRRLQAFVGIRDFAPKGTPAWKYLEPQVVGGPRRMKRLELRLSQLSGGQYIVPGKGARLDAYGNISRGQIQQLLSRLDAHADPQQNVSDKTLNRLRKKGLIAKGAKADYFIARSKGGNSRPKGVYQLVSPGHVQPVLIFTQKAPTYTPRFAPEKIVLQAVDRYGAKAIEAALADQLAHDAARQT